MSDDHMQYEVSRPSGGKPPRGLRPKKKHEEKELGSEILGEETPSE